MTATEKYRLWMEKVTDEEVRRGLIEMKDDPKRIENSLKSR